MVESFLLYYKQKRKDLQPWEADCSFYKSIFFNCPESEKKKKFYLLEFVGGKDKPRDAATWEQENAIICSNGGIGRRYRLKSDYESVWVQIPL